MESSRPEALKVHTSCDSLRSRACLCSRSRSSTPRTTTRSSRRTRVVCTRQELHPRARRLGGDPARALVQRGPDRVVQDGLRADGGESQGACTAAPGLQQRPGRARAHSQSRTRSSCPLHSPIRDKSTAETTGNRSQHASRPRSKTRRSRSACAPTPCPPARRSILRKKAPSGRRYGAPRRSGAGRPRSTSEHYTRRVPGLRKPLREDFARGFKKAIEGVACAESFSIHER